MGREVADGRSGAGQGHRHGVAAREKATDETCALDTSEQGQQQSTGAAEPQELSIIRHPSHPASSRPVRWRSFGRSDRR
jgi:hypothetical protein